jgi:hypothetical protein
MARHLRIRCVVKSDRTSAHERIRAIGGINLDGSRWALTQDKAILQIEDAASVFYIERPRDQRFDVIVAIDAHGNKYLRTVADRDQPEQLLKLPVCPD